MNKELIVNTYEKDLLLFKENTLGFIENNILKYENETDYFFIDLANEIFIKENLESILKIDLKKAVLTIKEINKTFDIALQKYLFIKENNKIIIEYMLETNEYPLKIEIEMSDINA